MKNWIQKYKAEDIEGLQESRVSNQYSTELKRQSVVYYLNSSVGLGTVCDRFNISSKSVLEQWIKLYTSGEGFKYTSIGSRKMTKGRKTTWKEHIEIAQYTLANELDYHKAEKKYGVSYQ